jgi:hypothetical protein
LEETIEQQHCQQKEQGDEDEDDIEAISGENKGPISLCQQINESLQRQRVEDETIVVAQLSQDRQHSVSELSTREDTISTTSSLFGPTTRDYQDLNANYFSEGEPRPAVGEQSSTCPVQTRRTSPNCSELAQTTDQDQIHKRIERTIFDELGSSNCDPLRERAAGLCDWGSVCDIADATVQALEEPGESPPSVTTQSQCNQMSQAAQRYTEARCISGKPCSSAVEERLREQKREQQPRLQQEQEDEDGDKDNKANNARCQQVEESLQHQGLDDETIMVASIARSPPQC